ncbi:MAG: heavy-metal-associated domain-containing protein [Pseudomonadota bacterium]
MNKTHRRPGLIALAALVLAAPAALAEHKGVPHDDEPAHDHAHGDHAHDHGHDMDHSMDHDMNHEAHMASPQGNAVMLKQTDAIAAALSAGGEPIVVDVLGVVCDFCAKAMNKTFGKREEVAAVHVDLDEKSLSLVLEDGASLDDEEITRLVKRAGYRLSSIRRGPQALGTATP